MSVYSMVRHPQYGTVYDSPFLLTCRRHCFCSTSTLGRSRPSTPAASSSGNALTSLSWGEHTHRHTGPHYDTTTVL